MLDLDSMLQAQRVVVLTNILMIGADIVVISDAFLRGVGAKLILSCNFDILL